MRYLEECSVMAALQVLKWWPTISGRTLAVWSGLAGGIYAHRRSTHGRIKLLAACFPRWIIFSMLHPAGGGFLAGCWVCARSRKPQQKSGTTDIILHPPSCSLVCQPVGRGRRAVISFLLYYILKSVQL